MKYEIKAEQLDKIIAKQKEIIKDSFYQTGYSNDKLKSELTALEQPIIETTINKSNLTPINTAEEQESKEGPKDMYDYPLTTANNHVQPSESKEQSAEDILKKHKLNANIYNGYFIDDIIKAMQEYAQQSIRDELIKYEIAQNTVGGKLHGSKERIIKCVDKYLNSII